LAVDGWQLAVGSWQLAVDGWQLMVGSWQLAVDRRNKEELTEGRRKKEEEEGKINCDIIFFGAVESCGTYFAWLCLY
jgi:hypothetical protein